MVHPSGVNQLSQPCIYGDFVSSYAERKSRFMKWLCKLFKGGSTRRGRGSWGVGHYPDFPGGENMFSHAPSSPVDDHSLPNKEKEERDPATALSSAEEFRRQNGRRWSTDRDEESAQAPYDNLSLFHPYDPFHRICAGCNRMLGYSNYLGCMGTYFHRECFRCHACGYPITEHEFSLAGNDPYHNLCFKERTHPKCEVCHQFIPTNGNGLIEYRCHPYWLQKYCPSHEHDGTVRCCSCERLEARNSTYYSLGDGRSLCLECMETAIMDTGDCQPLYHAIRDYYEGMNMKLDQQIPMLLVERQALNEAIVGEKHGHHHMPETRGLCLSEEQTVTSVHKKIKIGGHRFVRTQPQKLRRKCEVTAILVLYGLPRLLTGAILAHELMHGWLRLQGYCNLSPEVEEGICQVLSHMWLETEVMPRYRSTPSSTSTASSSSTCSKKGRRSEVENKLGQFFMYQIAKDASVAYGRGFRDASAAVNKYGLRITLDHIYLTGHFPL